MAPEPEACSCFLTRSQKGYVCGCLFHHCQAVLKYVKDNGYFSQYQNLENKELHGTVFMTLGLPYVNRPEDLEMAVGLLHEEFAHSENIDPLNYFGKYFLDNISRYFTTWRRLH